MTVPARSLAFRLSRSAYLGVLFLLLCTAPLAFVADGGNEGGPTALTWRLSLLALPVLAAVFIARTATFASSAGLRVRAVFGVRELPWGDVRGLSIEGRAVYAVLADGAVRLPCVRVSDLAAIANVSAGRLPAIAEPVRKHAPARRRR